MRVEQVRSARFGQRDRGPTGTPGAISKASRGVSDGTEPQQDRTPRPGAGTPADRRPTGMRTTELQLAETIAVRVDLSEPLLTAHQVAALLAIPRSSVYRVRPPADRAVPSITVGRHRRFYRSDVETWLASRRP